MDNPTGEQQQSTPQPEVKQQENAPEGASWHPQEFRGHAALKKFKTPEDAIKGYVNLETAFGKKFEEHLKDDAAPEIKARVRSALGVPESPEGYEPPKAPEGYEIDQGLFSSFAKVAHDAGISKSAWQKLSTAFVQTEMDRLTARSAESAKEKETGMAALQQEWGAATDRNIGLAQQVVSDFGGNELKQYLNETGLGNHPKMVKFLARMGQVLSEDNLMTPNPVGTSAETAKAEIAKIRGDKAHPYHVKDHPEHKSAIAHMAKLHELAFSEV